MKVVVKKIGFVSLFLLAIGMQAQKNLLTVGALPETISETSGLIYFNHSLITHNDSGNEALLFELDTLTLTIKRTVTVTNVENNDWEAITQDDDYIYIGDFGNNLGVRSNLAVYRISKTDYLSSDTVSATTIHFSYVDQIDFSDSGNSDWDAEAFFVLQNQLVILTKQWQSSGSVAYALPKIPGTYIASRVGDIANIGLVTDATYDENTNRLVVLGYSNILSPFIGIVENLSSQNIFNGFEQHSLPLNFVQAEGITQIDSAQYYFSSEFFSRQNPTIASESRLFSFQIKSNEPITPEEPSPPQEHENPEPSEVPDNEEEPDRLVIFRDNNTQQYHYSIATDKTICAQIIFDVLGRSVWRSSGVVEMQGIITPYLKTSVYYMTLYLEDSVIATPFVVY
ncbi:T9SS C-terminal target domain-containing protein [Maribacter sp. X9]|uniref:T9SS C-terminal target domain-containing protein n=1 Tax=Maribacter sp. X9 TaxID=3402159 RepID=UPI003AF33F52